MTACRFEVLVAVDAVGTSMGRFGAGPGQCNIRVGAPSLNSVVGEEAADVVYNSRHILPGQRLLSNGAPVKPPTCSRYEDQQVCPHILAQQGQQTVQQNSGRPLNKSFKYNN